MPTVIDELIYRIGLDSATFSAEQKRVLEEMDRLRRAGDKSNKELSTG